jgi:hypothetical protein
MKRFMIGMAAVMMTSAAWSQAPAQPTGGEGGAPFQCTLAINPLGRGESKVLTAKFKTIDACKAWALDANHLDAGSGNYELLAHDAAGKVVLHQSCTAKGLPLFGSSHTTFDCKDVA